ncbi:MAG: hypothetical protein KAJ07_04595 [Planctomycetes bacterium]|nr:hypothetical protein [Planctomycetota bacterium]
MNAALLSKSHRRRLGGVFSPLDLSPALWLDASDITTLFTDSAKTTPVTSDGDVVGAWADKSVNGRDVLQTVTAKKPLYKTGIQNGLASILGDGVDDCLSTASVATATTPFLMYVARPLSGVSGEYVHDGKSTVSFGGFVSSYASPNVVIKMITGPLAAQTVVMSDAAFSNYVFRKNGASSYYRKDGTQTNIVADMGTTEINGLVLGARGDGTLSTNMYFSEVILFSDAPSADNILLLENYMKTKWATP